MDDLPAAPAGPGAEDAAFLAAAGARLRRLRAQRGTTRRALAARAGVSERHIAQLEAGAGNISILLLRRLVCALGVGLEEVVAERADRSVERVLLEQAVTGLAEAELAEARGLLARRFGAVEDAGRRRRVALIGLRGAGKSTLGRLLADRLGLALIELDREAEREARMDIADIFATHGPDGFRRLERAALLRVIEDGGRAVIATGGGIVADPVTYALLLDRCVTVWLRATPEEHMRRVVAQGDTRPMADSRRAMADLRAILSSREALYARADIVLDTVGRTPEASVAELLGRLGEGDAGWTAGRLAEGG